MSSSLGVRLGEVAGGVESSTGSVRGQRPAARPLLACAQLQECASMLTQVHQPGIMGLLMESALFHELKSKVDCLLL